METPKFLLALRAYNPIVLSVAMALLFVGFFATLIVGEARWWSLSVLLTGIFLLALFLAANLAKVKEAGKKRSTLVAANFTLVAIAILFLVGALYYVISRHPLRLDLTSNKFYSLSGETVDVLQKLTKPVDVTLFMSSRRPVREVQRAQDLLQEYSKKSTKFHFKAIDMDRDTTEVKRLGIHEYNTVVFDNGDNRKDVMQRDYVTYSVQTRSSKFQGESAFTSALVKMSDTTHLTFYFTESHGEKSIAAPPSEGNGLGILKDYIERENYTVKSLNLLVAGKVPEDAYLIAVVGPTKAFQPQETELLRKFTQQGGKLLLCLDPIDPTSRGFMTRTGLEPLLKDFGVRLGNDLVVDSTSYVFPSISSVIPQYQGSPIVQKLSEGHVAVVMSGSRSVQKTEPVLKNVTQTVVFQTTDQGFGITNLKEKKPVYHPGLDTKGPVGMGLACEWVPTDAPTKKTRLVVYGNSNFLSNQEVPQMGNIDLALNSLNWAAEEESKIDIHPKEEEMRTLTLSAVASDFIKYLCVVIMPLIILSFGGYVWYRRRSL